MRVTKQPCDIRLKSLVSGPFISLHMFVCDAKASLVQRIRPHPTLELKSCQIWALWVSELQSFSTSSFSTTEILLQRSNSYVETKPCTPPKRILSSFPSVQRKVCSWPMISWNWIKPVGCHFTGQRRLITVNHY